MKYDKHLFTIIFIWIIVIISYLSNDYIISKNEKINYLTISYMNEIEKNKQYINNEKEYENTLKRIAENIYRTDSFLNFGGSGLDYDDENNLASILEGNSDFDVYLNDVNNFFDKRTTYFNHIPNIFPVKYSKYNRITSPFGDRLNPFTGKVSSHKGIDIGSIYHAKIIATADGVVRDNWIYHKVFGRLVIIDHGNGYTTAYAHMSKVFVHEGQKIKRGQVIGLMGSSGKAVGEHLHYEVRKDGVAIDPIPFLRGYENDKLAR